MQNSGDKVGVEVAPEHPWGQQIILAHAMLSERMHGASGIIQSWENVVCGSQIKAIEKTLQLHLVYKKICLQAQ